MSRPESKATPAAIPFPQAEIGQRQPEAGNSLPSQYASLGPLDEETQQALKRRLQSLGDVVVFSSEKFDACCASGHSIPPGAIRVRPRRCDHVFLVECLMPYWVEGLCPVCRCSFAYSRAEGNESDRCSSVSTSVSQRAKRLSPHRQTNRALGVEDGVRSLGSAAVARGPRVLRMQSDRQRSSSCGARSDASGLADRALRSPSRSGTGGTGISGSMSRTSSGHRDRPL